MMRGAHAASVGMHLSRPRLRGSAHVLGHRDGRSVPDLFGQTQQDDPLGHHPYIANYIISEARWKKLPERVRKLMWDAGEASTRNACGFADRANDADRDKLRQRGVHFVQFSAADRKQIETQLATVANEWAESLDKRGKPGTEVLKAFRAALVQDGR